MNRDSLDNFDYHVKSDILAATISATRVWAILGDSNLHIIDKSNPEIFSKHYIQLPSNPIANSCKIYVSPDEKNCAIIIPGQLFCFSLNNPSDPPKKVCLPPSGDITCGMWHVDDKKSGQDGAVFIFCTRDGEVFQLLNSFSIQKSNLLFMLKPKTPISNILVVSTTITYVFLVVSDRVFCFYGEEELALLFNRGPSNKMIMVGPSNSTTIERSCICNNQISIACAFGILTLFHFGLTKNQFTYKQSVTDYNAQEIISFSFCQYGAFIAKKDMVEFISTISNDQNPTRFSLPLPEVIKIVFGNDRIWFITQRRFYCIKYKKFLDIASDIALKNDDFDFVLQTTENTEARLLAIRHQAKVMKPSELAELLLKLNWSIQFIANIFMETPKILISYLELLLSKDCNFSIQIIHWTAILYSQQLPELSDNFLSFIEKYYQKFSKKAIIQVLVRANFWDGIEKYLDLIKDVETLITQCSIFQRYDRILSVISKTDDPIQFVKNIMKLFELRTIDPKDVFQMISESNPFSPDKIVPVLCQSPDFAIQYLTPFSYKRNDIYSSILVMAYCETGSEQKVFKMVKGHLIDPCAALRICLQANCRRAASQILWRLGKPELAVDMALADSKLFAKNLVENERDPEIQKRGWVRLLQQTSENTRREFMSEVVETKLFMFEEITDFVDDQDTVMQYGLIMKDAVSAIQKKATHVKYRTSFPPPLSQGQDTRIKLTDRCVLCGTAIIGQKFAIFPCMHMAHSDCLRENFKKFRKTRGNETNDCYLRSCPACGFASIPEASGTINV